jgi:hypothetical protein
MANEDTTNTHAETTTANKVVVPVPEPGQALNVTVDAEQIPQLNFDPSTESIQEFVGNDLVFTLDNGAVLTFVDFAASINDGEITSFMLEDGSIIPIDALIAAWNLDVPETAAGEATASGGASAYAPTPSVRQPWLLLRMSRRRSLNPLRVLMMPLRSQCKLKATRSTKQD